MLDRLITKTPVEVLIFSSLLSRLSERESKYDYCRFLHQMNAQRRHQSLHRCQGEQTRHGAIQDLGLFCKCVSECSSWVLWSVLRHTFLFNTHAHTSLSLSSQRFCGGGSSPLESIRSTLATLGGQSRVLVGVSWGQSLMFESSISPSSVGVFGNGFHQLRRLQASLWTLWNSVSGQMCSKRVCGPDV